MAVAAFLDYLEQDVALHATGSRLLSTKSSKPTLRQSTSHSIIDTSPSRPSGSYSVHVNDYADPSLRKNIPLNNMLNPSHTSGLTEMSHVNQTLHCSGGIYCNDALEDDPEILRPVSDAAIARYFAPDSIGRVVHPQQAGHALITNKILYTVAQRNAASLNMSFPLEDLTNTGGSCSLPPNPACNGSSTNTWTSRDGGVSAVSSFCSNYADLAGSAGNIFSATFSQDTLD
ncbi:hypothetical protein BDR22DRAFT_822260 [Usnea florida]